MLDYLNGFRGVAVILLVFGHYSIFFKNGQELFGPVAKIGVILFFILSAYLLTHEMITRKNINKEYLFNYIIKRILRIYPVLSVTLILLIVIPSFAKNMFGGGEWSLVNNFFLVYPEGNFWAISVEFEYYLLIPLIAYFVTNSKINSNLIILVMFVFAIFIYFYIKYNFNIPPNYPHLLPHISPFIFGSLIAIYENQEKTVIKNQFTNNIIIVFSIFGLIYAIPFFGKDLFSKLFGSEYLFHEFFANPLGIAISGSLLLLGLLYNEGKVKSIFSLKILQWLGLISFSIYCLHVLPVSFQGEIFTKYGNIIGVCYLTISTLIISIISYLLIERNVKKNINIIIDKIKEKRKLLLLIIVITVTNIALINFFKNNSNYNLIVNIVIPDNIGCFELYLDNNYSKPYVNCQINKEKNILEFKGINTENFAYRLDIGDKKNVKFHIHNITLTSNDGQELFKINSKQISELASSGLSINLTGEGITLDNDPRIMGVISTQKSRISNQNYEFPKNKIAIIIFINLVILILFSIKDKLKLLPIIGFILTILCSFPGSFNFDELYTLSEYWSNKLSDLHPIYQTISWASTQNLMIKAGFNYPLAASIPLIIQNIIFWYCAYFFSTQLNSNKLKIIFLLSLIIFPTFLVYNGHIGKDSQLAIALLFSITLLLKYKLGSSIYILALSLIPLFYAWGIRSNAPIAVIPIIVYFTILIFAHLKINIKNNKIKFTLFVISLLAIIFLSNKTINDKFIAIKCCYGAQFQMTPIYDVMGISYKINHNLIPPEYYLKDAYTIEDIKNNYNLFNVNWDGLIIPHKSMLKTTLKLWLENIILYPKEFVEFRFEVLKNFFGFTLKPTGYEFMVGTYNDYEKIGTNSKVKLMIIEINKFQELFLIYQSKFRHYLYKTNNLILYKIWLYILVLLILLTTLKFKFKEKLSDQYSILFYSGLFLCLPFIVLANSSHFRYVWWTAMALYFYIFIKLDLIISKLIKKYE